MSNCPDVYDCEPERVAEIRAREIRAFVARVKKRARTNREFTSLALRQEAIAVERALATEADAENDQT
jgi:hypothetical protein